MIKLENTEVTGWEHAIRGMRNPMNSWEKSDSSTGCSACDCHRNICISRLCDDYKAGCAVGPNDHDLMMKLASAEPTHAKYRRMIVAYVDITAPLYWWKEFDTYKVGTVANSCSTMHKIQEKEFTLEDFSHEHLDGKTNKLWVNTDNEGFMCSAYDFCQITCDVLNHYRELYLATNYKEYWWQMIQLLPSSYNQRRTIMLNYEVLASIYPMRKNHKLDEWHDFCHWIEGLPYSEIITGEEKK